MLRHWAIAAVFGGALAGCGGESGSSEPQPSVPKCADGEIALGDGSCLRPGISDCPAGFERAGGHGCAPILPGEDCPPGQLAIPGDDSCRPVGDCGDGPWGDLPVDDATIFVDRAYDGTSPDGTMDAPYPTISEALPFVPPGGLLAIAAGTYTEQVRIQDQTVRLWGRCPAMVEIAPPIASEYGIQVGPNASDTEIGGLSLTQRGMGVTAATDVLVQNVWIHHTTGGGLRVSNALGPTDVTLADALLEDTNGHGIRLDGAELEVQRTLVRNTTSDANEQRAFGIWAQPLCTTHGCDPAQRGRLVVADSHITRAQEAGLFVMAAEALIERSVVTHTQLRPSDGNYGEGVVAEPACLDGVCDLAQRASVTLRHSYVASNHTLGVFVMTSDVVVESSVVSDTLQDDGLYGRGLHVQYLCTELGCDHAARGNLVIVDSVVARCREAGVWNIGSDLTVATSVIRDALPADLDGFFGDGIGVMRNANTVASTHIGQTLLAHNHRAGIAAFGAELSLADTTIQCSQIDLSADPFDGNAATIVDEGGNVCRCGNAVGACKAMSASLAPPQPLIDP